MQKIVLAGILGLLFSVSSHAEKHCGQLLNKKVQETKTFNVTGFYLVEKLKDGEDKIFYFDKDAVAGRENALTSDAGKTICLNVKKSAELSPMHNTPVAILREFEILGK